MKTLNRIQTLSKIGRVLSKIVFIFSVIGFFGCIAGILGISFGTGSLIKLGGVTIHGIISENLGVDIKSVGAMLSGMLIVCAGEAVLAKYAEAYFKNELNAGSPFTLDGSKELMRLGILTIAVPLGCSVIGSIVEGIVLAIMNIEKSSAVDISFSCESSITLGIMFIIASLLCRYGAELKGEADKKDDIGRQ